MSGDAVTEKPVLTVTAPIFNEAELVSELVRRVVESCRPLGIPFELLLINDGSTDGTLSQLFEISRDVPELRVATLFRNFGHMPAVAAGISLAKGKAVVVMDGDLQDPPELIPNFYAQWKGGSDVVYGLRSRRREFFLQRWATSVFYWCLRRMTRTDIPAQVGTFCLMDRRIVDVLLRMPERDRYFAGLRAWIGGKQSFVSYDRPARRMGRSRVGVRGLFHLARTGLISFSKVPLRYASLFSLGFGLILFLIGLTAVLIRLFTNLAVPGWATFTTLIGMMGFVQSVVLAILSEYIAVIFEEIKSRPLFLVREQCAGGKVIEESG